MQTSETKLQDGTLNYTLLPAVTTGLRLLGAYLPALPTRIAALAASCTRSLEDLRWPRTGSAAVQVLSRIPGAPPEPGEAAQGAGGVISCLMLDVCLPSKFMNLIRHADTDITLCRKEASLYPSHGWRRMQQQMASHCARGVCATQVVQRPCSHWGA